VTVVSTAPDLAALRSTLVAEFDAPPTALWRAWADPALLQRWWGPPTWPATFTRHELTPGATSHYRMTGPDGREAHGWWHVTAVEEPRTIEFEDGFAHPDGSRDDAMPTTAERVEIEAAGAGSRMTVVTRFATAEQMQQLLDMGMVEGMREAVGQVDDLLGAA
jgi:uncharacterized protein YndB with AHSA1/START domain